MATIGGESSSGGNLPSSALTVISAAMRELGVLASGETPTAAESEDALTTLNRLIDAYATERLMIYLIQRATWTIVSGTGSYEVGSQPTGKDININPPIFIDHVSFLDTSTSPDTEYPLARFTEGSWANLRLKDQTSVFPRNFYVTPNFMNKVILGRSLTLTLWPIPTSSSLTGVIYSAQPVTQLVQMSATVFLPPGYERMLVKNLAVELAPGYEREISPLLMRQAIASKGNVKRANKRLVDLRIDPGALIQGRGRGSSYDIFNG